MNIIIGFIIMLILTAISSIPIFITAHFIKGGYSKGISWLLFVVCVVIYCILKVFCQEADILSSESNHIPILAMFIIYGISSAFVNKKIPSIFDTEKELKQKAGNSEKQEATNGN